MLVLTIITAIFTKTVLLRIWQTLNRFVSTWRCCLLSTAVFFFFGRSSLSTSKSWRRRASRTTLWLFMSSWMNWWTLDSLKRQTARSCKSEPPWQTRLIVRMSVWKTESLPQMSWTHFSRYITQEGAKLEVAKSKVPTTVTNAVSWRSEGIKYKKNEVFIDVIESINVLVSR